MKESAERQATWLSRGHIAYDGRHVPGVATGCGWRRGAAINPSDPQESDISWISGFPSSPWSS